jgi:hypothetical protein
MQNSKSKMTDQCMKSALLSEAFAPSFDLRILQFALCILHFKLIFYSLSDSVSSSNKAKNLV